MTNGQSTSLAEAVKACKANQPLMASIMELYSRVDAAVDAMGPKCKGGGTCCRFDLMGHRLFVSAGELAVLMSAKLVDASRCERRRCPYQKSTRCYAREYRPLGCRVFFCKNELTDWSNEHYERFHSELRNLHNQACVPYTYSELTASIAELIEQDS